MLKAITRICHWPTLIAAAMLLNGQTAITQITDSATLSRMTDIMRWEQTALQSSGVSPGGPVTLTWSVVPDGTLVAAPSGVGPVQTSNLVETFDQFFGQREVWFSMIEGVFDRWSDLSGVTYLYEPLDDGKAVGEGGIEGAVGTRGDIRIGGAPLSVGTAALGMVPGNGDIVIDTNDGAWGTVDARRFRNELSKAHGLGLGLGPLESRDAAFLMERETEDSVDGPQLDEILILHRAYGDANEKGRGNDRPMDATDVGLLFTNELIEIGLDARDVQVRADQTDYVSVDGVDDVDYYSFEASTRGFLWITLVPRGPKYSQARSGASQTVLESSAMNDLKLDLLSSSGAGALATADRAPIGRQEAISEIFLPEPGDFLIRVSGDRDVPQLYSLEIRFQHDSGVLGDINGDGQLNTVDIDQFVVRLRQGVTGSQFDLDGNDTVDIDDLRFLIANQMNTFFGDSNLDGEFNSSDLVLVFSRGQYDDGVPSNSSWVSGDWNGDGEFNSTDVVAAFQDGGYEQGPRRAIEGAAVPEPTNPLLLWGWLLVFASGGRKSGVDGREHVEFFRNVKLPRTR